MNYIEVSLILVSPEDYLLDLFIQDLADVGFESFEETELGIKAYAPSTLYTLETARSKILELFGFYLQNDVLSYEIALILHRNWNREWEMNFNPVCIGRKLRIRAPFHDSSESYLYELIIEPKMAFGTGHHETTTLMAQFLLEQDLTQKRVLDMGCGTGILGILADKMGAISTLAVDNDEVCYRSALENGLVNEISNMEVLHGDILKVMEQVGRRDSVFEIILANINRNVLIEQLSYYAKLITSNGNLFMSGFYEDDLEKILEKGREYDLKYVFHKTLNGWCAAQFCK